MWVTSNYVNCSRRNPKRIAQRVYHTGIPVWSTARAGIACTKKQGSIGNSSNIRWTFFQSLSMSSRREDLMDIDMVKSRETREYFTAHQLKKKCKKIDFQGIHDRFLRDQEFRIRMIGNHRDEDLCRRWDALADEDHTHHLKTQEYFHYKNQWWLHSIKQGFNTVPLRHRSDFKQALSTCNDCRRRTTCAYLLLQTPTMWGTKFIFYMVELARFMVDSLSFRKSRRRCTKYWVNGATRCLQYLASFFGKDFHEFNLFYYRLIVYSWRRSTVTDGGCKDNTSNDPFSRCKSVQ